MKFIRNARFRDRMVDILSKALLIAVSALVCLWMVSGASAVGVKQITGIQAKPQADGSYAIEFTLSEKLSTEDVAVDFERNFIQLSLKGVSAYPARTENINQAALEKVFTYQYQPDLARARLLLKTSAAAIKSKASWEIAGNVVRITVRGQQALSARAVAGDTLRSKASSTAGASEAATAAATDTEEERIVQEILSESKAKPAPAAVAIAASAASTASEEQPIFAAKAAGASAENKSDSPATRIFASLLLVIGVIGASAVAYRRFALGKSIGFLRQAKVIDVVSSQAVGPKRSIALVKVLDQYLVVGMSGDGMNLLANLGSDVKIEKFIDQSGPGASFNDAFENALASDADSARATGTGAVAHKAAAAGLGIRSSIKKRIEGFKPL